MSKREREKDKVRQRESEKERVFCWTCVEIGRETLRCQKKTGIRTSRLRGRKRLREKD